MLLNKAWPILTYLVFGGIKNQSLLTDIEVYRNLIITYIFLWFADLNYEIYPSYSIWLKIPAAIIIIDLSFGFIHLCFHRFKFLWKFHAQHHELTELVGLNALYSGVLEHVVVNLFPAYLAGLVFDYNGKILWFSFAMFNSVYSHVGEGYHQLHHRYPNQNFGTSLGLFDYLCF